MKIVQIRWLFLLGLAGLLWFVFVVFYSKDQHTDVLTTFTGETMGTTYHIRIRGEHSTPQKKATHQKIEAVLQSIVTDLSTWQENSALTLFNRSENLEFQEVPLSLWQLVGMARDLWLVSGGAYDVSAGALFQLWGFGMQRRLSPPDPKEILQALTHIGMDKIISHPTLPMLKKESPHLEIDLSSIAKGYAVDMVGQVLEEEGVQHYLVEIGGEVRVKGKKSAHQHWRVGIEKPLTILQAVEEIFEIEDIAMATSGNYRNYFEDEGERYAHIFNLKTGYPHKSKLASVTVFAPTTALADGWATALFASGHEKAQSIARTMALPVLLILHSDSEDKEFEIWISPAISQENGVIKKVALP